MVSYDDGNGIDGDHDGCNDDVNYEHTIVIMRARFMLLVMVMVAPTPLSACLS